MLKTILISLIIILTSCGTYAQFSQYSKEELKRKADELGIKIPNEQKEELRLNEKEQTSDTSKTIFSENYYYKTLPDSLFRIKEFQDRPLAKNLPAFGYNFFTYLPKSFEPSANIPVPFNYSIGPGDEIIISLWGEIQDVYNLVVRNDGTIFIPNVGLVNVNGLTIKTANSKIKKIMAKRYASINSKDARTYVDVSAGKLKSVKIFIVGEVNRPGGYTLPSHSTAFTALYFSGGPSLKGSLRQIKVMRKGNNIGNIDLYQYLIYGDASGDVNLSDGDVIFVPPVDKRIAVSGEVNRPGIYEIKTSDKLNDVLKYCGGLNFEADFNHLEVERIVPFNERDKYKNSRLTIDLNFKNLNQLRKSSFNFEAGDVLNVRKIDSLYENKIIISGEVKHPGVYELDSNNYYLRNLIKNAGGVKPTAFLGNGIIFRKHPDGKKELLSFNLGKILSGVEAKNLKMFNNDSVYIYNISEINPEKTVEIAGEVKNPGVYLRYKGLTLTKLIMLAGGVTDSARLKGIELTRMDTLDQSKYAEKIKIDLPKNYWNLPASKDIELDDYDRVFISADPNKTYNPIVFVKGEVLYPGSYALLNEGERVSDLIERAGGLKKSAYIEAIYVKRSNPIFHLVKKPVLPDSLVKYKSFFQTGILTGYSDRIPINYEEINKNTNCSENITLEPGDTLIVPKNPNVVYVVGEVGIPATVKYKKGASLSYYINQAGGYTQNSDEGGEIVILPNGRKWEPSGWFFIPDPEILSGSTILVPTIYEIKKDAWPIIRDTFSIISSATIIILTVYNLTR